MKNVNDGFYKSRNTRYNKNLLSPIEKFKSLETTTIGFSNYLKSGANNDKGINININMSLKEIRLNFIEFLKYENGLMYLILEGNRNEIEEYIDNIESIIKKYCINKKIEIEQFYEILMLGIGYIRSDTLMNKISEDEQFPGSKLLDYFNSKINNTIKNKIKSEKI